MKIRLRDNKGKIYLLDASDVLIQMSSSLSSSVILSSSIPSRPPVTGTLPPPTSSQPPVTGSTSTPLSSSIDVTFVTKEVANSLFSSGFPTSVVVPLPYGALQSSNTLSLVDGNGIAVPAQVDVLNRHYARDNSIRHVIVHYQPQLGRFVGQNTGLTTHRLISGKAPAIHPTPVVITETASTIVAATGSYRLMINKAPFSIMLPTGALDMTFYAADNSEQKSFNRNDISTVIEERGPMRSCIRMSAPTTRVNGSIVHGWAIRIYMFAGKSYAKIDVQLQNCDMTQMYSNALNFDGLEISVPANGAIAEIKSLAPVSVDPSTLPLGALDATTTWGVIRNFQQMFPTGIRSTGSKLIFDLWPRWSSQFINGVASPAGLYTLDDQQCVIKELLIGLSPLAGQNINYIASTFQYHPVAVLPRSWYERTQVTLDMGGVFPVSSAPMTDNRKPNYSTYSNGRDYSPWTAAMGYNLFGCDPARRIAPGQAGGWPYSNAKFFLSGDPADYFFAHDFAMAELNCMPEWFINYTYAIDFNRIKPTENPYGGRSWRSFDAAYGYTNNAYGYSDVPGYPSGISQEVKPRDDQHAWFYHVEEAYYISGNPWIKDWYKGIAEFRKTRLNQKDPWPDISSRAVGHSLSHALQAYRITGDLEIIQLVGTYVKNYLAPLLDATLGGYKVRQDYPGEAMFQIGYLCHALITYLCELQTRDINAFNIIGGFTKWNLNYARYGYYNPLTNVNNVSDGTSMSFCDAAAWWVLQTNDDAVRLQLVQYLTTGIGGGQMPYIDLQKWAGDFLGRYVTALKAARGGTI